MVGVVFQVAKNGAAIAFTIRSVEKNLGCSYNTAASILNILNKNTNIFLITKKDN